MTNRRNPRERANILSFLCFGYTLRLFRKGLKKDLEEEDLYGFIESCESKICGDETEEKWNKSKSIYELLWTRFGFEYSAICVATILWTEINSISQPYGQSRLISYFEESQSNISKWDAYFCAALVTFLKIASIFFWRHIAIYEFFLAMKIQASLKSLLYRKALKLSPAAFGDTNLGNIVTILTKDINCVEENLWIMMEFIIAFIQTATISYLLWTKMEYASIVGIGLLFLTLPIQIYLSSLLTRLRLRVGKYTDARLQVTQETLSFIKIIKMYGWENFFYNKISEARKKEISVMIKAFYLKFGIIVIALLTSKLTFLILILFYVWLGYTTSTETIFYVLTLYYDLRTVFGFTIPLNTSRAADFRAGLIRLNKLLNTADVEKITEGEYSKPSIELKNVSARIKEMEILQNVSLKIDNSGLTMITGIVGSGKSSVLKAILREYTYEGNIGVHGTVSYASQEPWLFPSSIRDNILFGQKYERDRYQETIRVCALEYDFTLLEQGDKTLVADRGINLSKGQQARVNLARAIYKDSDIYLLDDSLTALDVRVQDYIFNECICKFLSGKICVLVTQNDNHLKLANTVISLEHGRMVLPQNLKTNEAPDDFNELFEQHTSASVALDSQTENKVYREIKKSGKVEMVIYNKYFEFGGGIFLFSAIMLLFVIAQFVESYSDQLLTNWVDQQQEVLNLSNNSSVNTTYMDLKVSEKDNTFIWYTVLSIVKSVMGLAKFYALLGFCRNASLNVHKVMSFKVVKGVMSFFDTHFIGNILNRFSYDLYNIDENLPFIFPDMTATLFVCAGSVALLTNVNWIFAVPSGVFIFVLVAMRMCYIPTGRSLKRLEASTRSPLVGYINSSLEGLPTIRAFQAEQILKDQFDINQNLYTSAYFTLMCTLTGFEFFMDIACAIFSTLVVVRFLFFDHDISAGNVGLALTQVFMLTEYIQWGMRQWAEIENYMTSVERVLEYTNIKNEESLGRELENWPTEGSIVFRNVTLGYAKSIRPVLRDISFSVKPGHKIGIVGRTGAGKSSIISILFRLYDFQGDILIDGVNIKELSLSFLRKNIAIVPQDPILFNGTIRTNIDPYESYTDEELWAVIEKVKIKHLIPNLDLAVTEGGSSFSAGQKQLICLARAAVGSYKIVVLDEATAKMDAATDEMLHSIIREIFPGCTMVIIAHRLGSITDCDMVMVMEKGELIEFDTPDILLGDSNSVFYKMCTESYKNT